jgi:hypothetical protein
MRNVGVCTGAQGACRRCCREGLVRAVGQVTGFKVHGDRIELQGHVLPEGHTP